MKQVQLCFSLMSKRRERDYRAVFQAVRDLAPNLEVVTVTTDFEIAIWTAARAVFEDVTMRGCSFHWAQAVWRKLQELGLATSYMNSGPAQDYMRLIFALPFIPAEHIRPSFRHLAAQATDQLRPLINYVRDTWISGQFAPEAWCVYKRSIRTNNDVEGWHNRLNLKAGHGNLPMFLIIQIIHMEATLIPLTQQLIAEDKLRKYQRLQTRAFQGRLSTLWTQYREGGVSTSQLLKSVSRITAPSTD